MADNLTADDLRTIADRSDVGPDRRARARAAADLLDQGWKLTPPPQPGTVNVNADDLRRTLRSHRGRLPADVFERLFAALAEADRG